MIAKQHTKREQTHPVFLQAMEKYKKVEGVNAQNDSETTSKKWTDKNKTHLFCDFCKCLNSEIKSSTLFKRISRK